MHTHEYRLFLCKIDKTQICELVYTELEYSAFLSEFNELKFTIEGNEQGVLRVEDQRFDLVSGMYLIKLEKTQDAPFYATEYFVITENSLTYDNGMSFNNVSCFSSQYMPFIRRKLRGYLRQSETLLSVLSYIVETTLYNTWSLGNITINPPSNSSSGLPSYYGTGGLDLYGRPIVLGNLDLHNRPIILDGPDYHTLYSFSFADEVTQDEILIPKVRWGYNGVMSDQEAIDWYKNSAQFLAKFTYDPLHPDWAWESADAYAITLHNENAVIYDPIAATLVSSLYIDLNEYHYFDFQDNTLKDVFDTLSTDFDIIFNFDNVNNIISCKKRNTFTTIEGIVLSPDNFINSVVHTPKYDQIITRLYIYGKDGLTISQYNMTGQPYVDDFSYFIDGGYFSTSLKSAWDAYVIKVASYGSSFAALINSLNLYESSAVGQLLYLQNELANLTTQKKIYDSAINVLQSAYPNEARAPGYNAVYVNLGITEAAIVVKNAEILAKEGQITATQASISAIIADLSYDNLANFTTIQMQELSNFILEDTITMDSLEDAQLLLQYGIDYVAKKNQPIIEIDVDMVDLFGSEDAYLLRNKIVIGSYMYFDVPSIGWNYDTLQLIGYTHNPINNSLNFKFSNTNRIESDIYYLNDMFKHLNATSTIVNNNLPAFEAYTFDKPNIITTSSTIESDKTIIRINDGSVIDHRGFVGTDIGGDGHLKLTDDKLILTRDDWASFTTLLSANGLYLENSTHTSRVVITPDTNLSDPNNKMYGGFQIDKNVGTAQNPIWDNRMYLGTNDEYFFEGNIFVGDDVQKIVIDRYGLDPTYAIWFKNMLPNTDGAIALAPPIVDVAIPFAPWQWLNCMSSSSATFRAGRSFKVAYNDVMTSDPKFEAAKCNPTTLPLITRGATPLQLPYMRFSWWSKYGSVQVAIKDITHGTYFSIVKEATPIITIGNYTETFDRNDNWTQQPDSIWFDPQELGHMISSGGTSDCVDIRIEITNVYSTDPTEFLYVNAPMLTIDKTGKWAQAYISGPFSLATSDGSTVDGGGLDPDGGGGTLGNLYVEVEMPANAPNKAVLVEIDNPTIDDGNTAISELTLTWASPRQQRITGTSPVHLPDPSTNRNIQGDAVNHDGVVMFCIFNANEETGVISIDVLGSGTMNHIITWYIYPQESFTVRTEPTNATKNWEVV
jgi:hypothetical protein